MRKKLYKERKFINSACKNSKDRTNFNLTGANAFSDFLSLRNLLIAIKMKREKKL